MNLEEFLTQHPEYRPVADYVVLPPTGEELGQEFPDASPDVLSRALAIFPIGQTGVTRGCVYAMLRRKGSPDRWASMVALQSPPQGATTDTFWAGRKPFWAVFGEQYANDVRKRLAAQGVRLGENQEYMPELARFRGDPQAVVSFSGARDYIRKLCEQRGTGCEGAVKAQSSGPTSDPLAYENCMPLGEDIIRSRSRELVAANPDLGRKSRREIRQMVIEKHGPPR